MGFSIEGKTAIVTGAANGVGLAVARHFADKGANVMFADMDEESLIKECGCAPDEGKMRYFAGDLRERLTMANLISATLDAYDRIDILVNSSRQMQISNPLDLDDGSTELMLEQNLMTALRLSQMVAKKMIKQAEGNDGAPAGSIVNLSSIAARRSNPDLLGYSISCAALEQMTRSMAVALAPNRIRVNAVSFGSVMSSSLRDHLRANADDRSTIQDGTPLNRIAEAAELADAVQFLASEGSGFITGQIITADGGRTLIDPVSAAAH